MGARPGQDPRPPTASPGRGPAPERTPLTPTPPRPRILAVALALLALAAVLPPAGAQDAPREPRVCEPLRGEPAFHDDAEVRSWSGDVAANGTGDTLEVGSHRAGAYLVPWNRSAWRVEVGEVDPNDELEVSVEASEDGGFSLSVRVEPRSQGIGDLSVSPSGARAQVKAWVPQRAYAEATLASRSNDTVLSPGIQTSPSADDGWDALVLGNVTAGEASLAGEAVGAHVVDASLGRLDVGTSTGDACLAGLEARTANVSTSSGETGLADVEAQRLEATAGSGDLGADGLVVDTLEVVRDSGETGVRDLTAREATFRSGSGDVTLNRSGADSLDLRLDSGDTDLGRVTAGALDLQVGSGDLDVARSRITDLEAAFDSGDTTLQGLTVGTLALQAGSGDLDARAVEARDLVLSLDSGDVDGEVRPVGNGTWNVSASSGEVDLHVPASEGYGYDAVLRTDSGEPTIEIPGTEVVSRSEHRLHVRTIDYDDRTIRTRLRVATASGDVTADDDVSSDPSSFGSGGRTYGVIPGSPSQAAADFGVLAVLAAVATVAWPKVRTFVVPLYSRIAASDVLHHPARQRIHDLVREEPGLHFREIQRRLETGRGVLEHHLDKLVDADVLAVHEAHGYTCYFVQGSLAPDLVEVAPLVRAETARALLVAAHREPGASVNALAEAADVSNSTASYHLDKLQEAALVVKDRGSNGLEVRPSDLGRRAVEALNLEADLAVSENRA